MFTDLVTDSLTEYSYDADLAGLTYQFGSHNLGVYCTVSGYNDKLGVLAKVIFEGARNLVVTQERLHVVKSSVGALPFLKYSGTKTFMTPAHPGLAKLLHEPTLPDIRLSRPLSHDREAVAVARETGRTSLYVEFNHAAVIDPADMSSAITVEELQAHIEKLFANVHIHALVVGNMYKDEAIQLIETAEHTLRSSAATTSIYESGLVPPNGKRSRHAHRLSDSLMSLAGVNSVWTTPVPNPNEPNSALTYYVHLGSQLEPRTRVTAALLTQILHEPAFNVLRTREQLGYIVACGQWTTAGSAEVGMRIIVQSERAPAFLEERVDAFLDEMLATLEAMTEEEFLEHKHGLEKNWTEDPKNLREETNRYWAHIDSGYLDFYRSRLHFWLLPCSKI